MQKYVKREETEAVETATDTKHGKSVESGDNEGLGSSKQYSRAQLREKNAKYLAEQKRDRRNQNHEAVKSSLFHGLLIGGGVFSAGLEKAATACKAFVPANPVLQALGIAIVVGTLAYAAFKYFF